MPMETQKKVNGHKNSEKLGLLLIASGIRFHNLLLTQKMTRKPGIHPPAVWPRLPKARAVLLKPHQDILF